MAARNHHFELKLVRKSGHKCCHSTPRLIIGASSRDWSGPIDNCQSLVPTVSFPQLQASREGDLRSNPGRARIRGMISKPCMQTVLPNPVGAAIHSHTLLSAEGFRFRMLDKPYHVTRGFLN